MDEDEFWLLLEECRPPGADPDAERLAAALEEHLSAGPVAAVAGFAERLSTALYRLDRRELGEELSGDAFLYARAAVVADGRAAHRAVLADPRRFAPYAEGLVWAEPLLYVPDRAYRRLTGEQWRRGTAHSYESRSNAAGWAR
ncbi:DUF4240 domain-containing protein [Kitasatospora phosalacinea]|uniref:DUF4240 domain-containing protein n=1 Tax=Kitasatospora phosalacinea TaxID=2065 RepID=UPI0036575559